MTALVACVACACEPSAPREGAAPSNRAASSAAAASPSSDKPTPPPPRARAFPADRCGECHDTLHAEWKTSAHAAARRSPLYVAMRERAKDPGCEACHAPLAALTDPAEMAVDEGVTCEACHAIREVTEKGDRPQLSFDLEANRKFGPYCDAKDNYFHKMGCAPSFREARICGGCHAFSMPLGSGKSLPIFTEYAEWRASSFSISGTACQECHMPAELTHAATGAERKVRVGHHGFMGQGGEIIRKALGIVASAAERAGKLEVSVVLKNEGAGHAVPSGMPGRQVVVRVEARDDAGPSQAREERVLGRVLVDDAGREVPFYAARAEKSDERIAAGGARTFTFELDAPRAGSLVIEVAWRSASPAITAALGVPAEERSMGRIEIPFGEKRAGKGREHLPKTVVIRP
ncbi:multiheme c-type cytochrome [Polyangium spumosum]|uniref:multiheme c-type cytochrome n=1 Tax=Polyangium spumosum TaxID=889282 RepID=UPI00129B210E